MKIVEGVHYIFDRYAFLNAILKDAGQPATLTPESPQADLKKAIKHGRALYHTDRQTHTGQKLKDEARHQSDLIGDCAEVLTTSPERKARYDEKLAEFKEKKPNQICDDGKPFMLMGDLLNTDLSFLSLLSNEERDTAELEKKIDQLAQSDEASLQTIKKLYNSDPSNSALRTLYRTSLSQKFVNATAHEDIAWLKTGIEKPKENKPLQFADEYTTHIEGLLETVRTQIIPQAMTQHMERARLGRAALPLLLGNGSEIEAAQQAQVLLANPEQLHAHIEKLISVATENFNKRAEHVRQKAANKQDVLQELLKLTITKPLNEHAPANTKYELYLVTPKNMLLARLDLDAATGRGGLIDTPDMGKDFDEVAAKGFTDNAILIEHNNEIEDPLTEFAYVAETLVQEHLARRKARKARTAKPLPEREIP